VEYGLKPDGEPPKLLTPPLLLLLLLLLLLAGRRPPSAPAAVTAVGAQTEGTESSADGSCSGSGAGTLPVVLAPAKGLTSKGVTAIASLPLMSPVEPPPPPATVASASEAEANDRALI
jgi:hypothetical protein